MAGCGTTGMADCPPPYYGPSQAQRFNPPPNSYVVNSKIMVVAVAVLFAVVVFILCLHVYAKWFWRNQGALGATDGTLRTVSWRRRRRVLDPNQNSPLVVATQQSAGLEKSVIAALPVFEVDAKMLSESALECAVCLEEFEEGEKGRTLPKCGHHFHIECVDMWLHSHSTCPLCRASVRPDDDSKTSAAATTTTTNDIEAQTEAGPVIGDVHAPFMAAMRASRRRQRSLGRPSPPESVPTENAAPTESSPPSQEEPTTSGGPKALALEYESIPSNVLFWGNSNGGGQPSASGIPSQVTIDIPPAGTGAAGSSSTAMSPMARASANFRRLLSRGKSVVSPQDAADEGGPSSPHPPPPPSPPSNAA